MLTMGRNECLPFGIIIILVAACAGPSGGIVEQRFIMPGGLGTFVIHLDTNLHKLDSGISHGCIKCEDQFHEIFSMRNWPDSIYSELAPFDISRDSLFRFTWLSDLYSPSKCDSPQTVQAWMEHELSSRRIECSICTPIDSGFMMVNGTRWAYIRWSDSNSIHNDRLECYTVKHQRGVHLMWQRLARSPARFNFREFAFPQLNTARYE